MLSATSSLVAVISRMDELDSALEVSVSTCCAISRMPLVQL